MYIKILDDCQIIKTTFQGQFQPTYGPPSSKTLIKLQKIKTGVLIATQSFDSYNFIESFILNTPMQRQVLSLDSRVQLDQNNDSERKLIYEQEISQFQRLIKRQENIKNNLAFWNAMAEGKLETISSCGNLFILLLMITLGGHLYNGPQTNGPEVLGWICVAQTCFFYLLVLLVKFIYIPSIERELQQCSSEGFKLYKIIGQGKKQIKNLDLMELELLEETVSEKSDKFRRCFPNSNSDQIIDEIKLTLASRSTVPYHINREIKQVKLRERNAKWWQTFWQVFVLGKTFSIPGVLLLVFILTPLSIATPKLTSKEMNNGQGWLAVGFWAAGIAVFIIIKLFLWDYLDGKVENARSDSFIAYYPISLKQKQLKSLNLQQLTDLEKVLNSRATQFERCFKEPSNEVLARVRALLRERLPNKKSENEETPINNIIAQEKSIQNYNTAWISFFNLRIVVTIINILKFLIVVAITFVIYYPANTSESDASKRAVGALGIGVFIGGYIFYFMIRGLYLPHLEKKTNELRSSPFTTFRLVYFGNKKLNELEVHELEDVSDGLNNRKSQFLECFPNINPETLDRDINSLINDKNAPFKGAEKASHLLKKQNEAKKNLAFWSGYVDGPLMSSMYSVYVLLVLLLVSLGQTYAGVGGLKLNEIFGWVGVANLATLIVIVLVFKLFLIEYMTNSVKALRVDGYSEFNLVYTKTKQLSAVELPDLEKIARIIETNPVEFRKCFPKAELSSTLKSVKDAITVKTNQKAAARIRTAEEQVEYQLVNLELNRCTVALASWTSLVKDKLFVLTPLAIVIYILWGQCIATTLYGETVSGFLTVANLSVIALILLFYNLYYRGYLEDKISECKRRVKALETRQAVTFNI